MLYGILTDGEGSSLVADWRKCSQWKCALQYGIVYGLRIFRKFEVRGASMNLQVKFRTNDGGEAVTMGRIISVKISFRV
jgi:hypothetical protein